MIERARVERYGGLSFCSDYFTIEKVLIWLEREDTGVEMIAGYGLCLVVVTYFLARLLQFFIGGY